MMPARVRRPAIAPLPHGTNIDVYELAHRVVPDAASVQAQRRLVQLSGAHT